MPTPHLVTTVGGSEVPTLEPMLRHYIGLGVKSVFLNLHLWEESDPIREQVDAVARRCGVRVTETYVGDWHDIQQESYARPRRDYPNDWFILADSDELQEYDGPLEDIVAECERHGWDHVKGCFVDRLAGDGSFPAVDAGTKLEDQFPLGAMLTFQVLGADPRKATLVHGAVYVAPGQHFTYSPSACPPELHYVPVHHYKWTAGIPERLRVRIEQMQREGAEHWTESQRFLDYIESSGGRIDLNDERLLIGPCRPAYERWAAMRESVLRLD